MNRNIRLRKFGFKTLGLIILLLVVVIVFAGWVVWGAGSKYDDFASNLNVPKSNTNSRTVVAVGDIVCDPNDPHLLVKGLGYCQDTNTYRLTAKLNPDGVLLLGDLQYENGTLDKFNSRYDKSWGKLKSISYPTPGNHEYRTADASGYFNYFNDMRSTGRAGEVGKGYYSFKIAGWHFISLNSNCEFISGCDEGSPQLEWLRRDLKKNQSVCTAAIWHHPRFTSGTYENDQKSRNLSADFWRILTQNKADLILNGHDHIYERFAPQSPNGKSDENGIRQFIIGTGGKILYQQRAKTPNSEKVIDDNFGVLVLELNSNNYSWQFISLEGKVLDSGSQQCVN